MIQRHFKLLAWLLSFLVAILAFVAWSQGLRWQLDNLSIYKFFPLLGLLAFSLMWSMYVVGFTRRHWSAQNTNLKTYYKFLSPTILGLILLHPGLLVWQLWRDGFGLPPASYKTYVGPAAVWAVIVSSIAWFIFLAFELRRRYKDRHWWRYIEYAGDAAMIGIFFHALRLGSNLQAGWFRTVWFIYGVTLAAILINKYTGKVVGTAGAKS